MKKNTYWIIGISVLVAALRWSIPGVHRVVSWEDSYEALAHIWVGWLFAVVFLRKNLRKPAVWCLCITSAIELVGFFVSRLR
jgi:hypothetical protein